MQKKTEIVRIPNELCQKIMNCEYELDAGVFTEQMVIRTTELYSVHVVFIVGGCQFFSYLF